MQTKARRAQGRVLIDATGGNLRRMESAIDDAVPVIDAAVAIGEGETEFAVGAGEAGESGIIERERHVQALAVC